MKDLMLFTICTLLVISCSKDEKPGDEFPFGFLAGGETTIFSSGPDAFTFPLGNLDQNGIAKHFQADGAFGQHFVSSPSELFGGLGPLFNQNSCEGCHVRNGRGTAPQFDNDPNSGLLLRVSIPGSGANGKASPVPGIGGQFQNKAIFGTEPEGKLTFEEVSTIVQYLDGNTIELTKPIYSISQPYVPVEGEILISPRIAPPVHGLGLLEAIPLEDILAQEDVDDLDGDGISGKANWVWDVLKNDLAVGLYGWKAEQPTAAQQAADAAHNDMGLTSFYFPVEHCDGQANCVDGLQNELDIDEELVDLMAYYFQTLAVPSRRNMEDSEVKKGEKIFNDIQCGSCHKPQFTTGHHPIKELSNQIIFPYSDMLLHDMGEGLADHRPTYLANGNEWRTPPLWGIGLTQVVNSKATFLHDGRAKTLEEAILWHGGEADQSTKMFKSLNVSDRNALLAFLKSL